jgi:alginate O-acetyltransferase complex protein AlgI
MVFSSFVFLCIFFPITFLLHTFIKNVKARNVILILASIVFYTYGEPVYILLLAASVCLNYFFGVAIGNAKERALSVATTSGRNTAASEITAGKLWLILSVIFNIGILVVFKYTALILTSLNNLLPSAAQIPVPEIRLPIGISFFTFQILSYVVDVYRGDAKVQRSFFRLFLYISFFPQLIAGPIVKYHDIETALENREVTVEGIKSGIYRFCCGMGKKILIANTMAYITDQIFGVANDEIGIWAAWVGAVTYLFQIYFDFSGYSDMAIGLGRIFGFEFKENFIYPYISCGIQEFWRRWHVSLSTWFKEYLYIPLGGNRKGKKRTILNKYIVFAATGIWHGASWTFLIWGLYHGTLQMLEQIFGFKRSVKKPLRVLQHIYTVFAVMLGFVIFRADDMSQALCFIKAMFGFGCTGGLGYVYALQLLAPYNLLILIFAIVGCTPLPSKIMSKLKGNAINENGAASPAFSIWDTISMLLCLVCVFLCFQSLASDSYNPFIYFRF